MTSLPTLPLGNTGLTVPALGIGTWQWGDRLFWRYGVEYGDADLRVAFEASIAHGLTFFDTAEVYGRGQSERLLGRFIRETGAHVFLATKFMPLPYRLGRGSLRRALSRSLQRLGLSQVDLYQMHAPLPPVRIETWMEAMADAVEAGLVRSVGVSNYNADQMRRAHEALAKRGIPLAANQVDYSLLQRGPERNGIMAACRELGITLIAYSPLAMGLLSGKYTPENPPPALRRFRQRRGDLRRIQPLVALLRAIGEAHGGKSAAQVALNWVMAKGAVPIPGVKNARHVEESAAALGWRLSGQEVAALDAASAPFLR